MKISTIVKAGRVEVPRDLPRNLWDPAIGILHKRHDDADLIDDDDEDDDVSTDSIVEDYAHADTLIRVVRDAHALEQTWPAGRCAAAIDCDLDAARLLVPPRGSPRLSLRAMFANRAPVGPLIVVHTVTLAAEAPGSRIEPVPCPGIARMAAYLPELDADPPRVPAFFSAELRPGDPPRLTGPARCDTPAVVEVACEVTLHATITWHSTSVLAHHRQTVPVAIEAVTRRAADES